MDFQKIYIKKIKGNVKCIITRVHPSGGMRVCFNLSWLYNGLGRFVVRFNRESFFLFKKKTKK